MKIIALPTDVKEARDTFGILHSAAFQGDGAKNHADVRTLGKLQDDLEAVSHDGEPFTGREGNVITPRVLNDGVTEIRLEDARYEMLKARFFGASVQWHALAARRVSAAYDLVDKATTEEKPVAKKAEQPAEPVAAPTPRKKR